MPRCTGMHDLTASLSRSAEIGQHEARMLPTGAVRAVEERGGTVVLLQCEIATGYATGSVPVPHYKDGWLSDAHCTPAFCRPLYNSWKLA
jgi:hypothetical protein